VTPRAACAAGAVVALAASAGDLLLLWCGNAGRPDLPALPAPPEGALALGHTLGVLAIPLYAVGYWGVARGIGRARRGAARLVFVCGALGGAYGGAVHGITAMAERLELAAGVAPGDPAAFVARQGVFLVPLWGLLGVLVAAGSLAFARAVAAGGTAFPRWMALANPAVLIALAVALALPTSVGRALLAPAAPNLAHVWFFALAGLCLGAAPAPSDPPARRAS
jgi:hypothetical protein